VPYRIERHEAEIDFTTRVAMMEKQAAAETQASSLLQLVTLGNNEQMRNIQDKIQQDVLASPEIGLMQ
jgi:hypothetical protein